MLSEPRERHEDFDEGRRRCSLCGHVWWPRDAADCPSCAEFARARSMQRLSNALDETERMIVAVLLDEVLEHPDRMVGLIEPEHRAAALNLRARLEEVL